MSLRLMLHRLSHCTFAWIMRVKEKSLNGIYRIQAYQSRPGIRLSRTRMAKFARFGSCSTSKREETRCQMTYVCKIEKILNSCFSTTVCRKFLKLKRATKHHNDLIVVYGQDQYALMSLLLCKTRSNLINLGLSTEVALQSQNEQTSYF